MSRPAQVVGERLDALGQSLDVVIEQDLSHRVSLPYVASGAADGSASGEAEESTAGERDFNDFEVAARESGPASADGTLWRL